MYDMFDFAEVIGVGEGVCSMPPEFAIKYSCNYNIFYFLFILNEMNKQETLTILALNVIVLFNVLRKKKKLDLYLIKHVLTNRYFVRSFFSIK